MAMNEHTKNLIRSVADNDLQKAKAYVKVIIANEKAASNQVFCQHISNKLQTPEANMLELPHDVKALLKMEDVSISFNEARHFLTSREQIVFENICTANEVNGKLSDMGIRYLNATLLYGESGTGKTMFGRYTAYKLGVPFAYLNFAHCISSYLGSTAKNIEKVFDFVKKTKCVFMLDEVDAIGIKRDNSQEVGEMSRVVIGLMQALDLLENEVVVIGATNRLDIIDEALIRRFSLKHEVKCLTTDESLQLATVFLDDVGIVYDPADVAEYAKSQTKQSEIINGLTLGIVRMLKDGSAFLLMA